MEQHPIPQDVTGFQFKLIGTMTVKQFGYVAFGAILATLMWYAPMKEIWWQLITKVILMPIFGASGIIVAFVPIEGRPVDVMTMNFFHALVSPNQYIYIKKGRKFSFTQITYAKAAPVAAATTTTAVQKPMSQINSESKKEKQLRAILSSSYKDSRSNLDQKEFAFLQSVASMPVPSVRPIQHEPVPQPATHVIQELKITPSLTLPKKPSVLDQNPAPDNNQSAPSVSVPKQEAPATQPSAAAEINSSHQKVLDLQKQTQDIHAEKLQVEQELLRLKNQLSTQKPVIEPALLQPQPQTAQSPAQDIAHVRNIPQSMTKSAGFSHVSDTPNVVIGIIKDSRGNILPNILVEIKDKDGNPVRAFKTNPLGQFASATPLPNGIYSIELEDPKKLHMFDTIQINAVGQIMLPIEIISHDARAELHQALFN